MKWLAAIIIAIICSIPIRIIASWSLNHFKGDTTASWLFTIFSYSGIILLGFIAFWAISNRSK